MNTPNEGVECRAYEKCAIFRLISRVTCNGAILMIFNDPVLFLPRDAMHSTDYAVARCLSVCLSHAGAEDSFLHGVPVTLAH